MPEFLEGDILPDRGVEVDLHPQLLDHLDLRLEHVLGEAVLGDADGEPAAGHGQGLEDVDVVAFDRQIVRRGESGGTGADDGDLFALLLLDRGDEAGLVLQVQVGHETLQVHDVDRLVHLSPLAGLLAGVVADPAADDGKGIVPLDELQGFLELSRRDQGHVPLDADVGGAGRLAGGGPQLVDRETGGNGLGKVAVHGLAGIERFVEVGGNGDGADIRAVPAPGALGQVDEPGGLGQADPEPARLTLDGLHGPPGHDLDIGMPSDLDQLRGEDAGRTVVRGKGLVQLGHDAADADPLLDEEDLHPGVGKIERGLDARNPRPHHHDCPDFIALFQHPFTPFSDSVDGSREHQMICQLDAPVRR